MCANSNQRHISSVGATFGPTEFSTTLMHSVVSRVIIIVIIVLITIADDRDYFYHVCL